MAQYRSVLKYSFVPNRKGVELAGGGYFLDFHKVEGW